MPTVVPSQIVQYIDKTFSEDEKRGSRPIVLGQDRSGALNALLTFTERVPNALLPSDPEVSGQMLRSIEEIRFSLKRAETQEFRSTAISGPPELRPSALGVIRTAFASCPDEITHGGSQELVLIRDPEIRCGLLRDLATTRSALLNEKWKPATVIAGSLLEALLLWAVKQRPEPDFQGACSSAVSKHVLAKAPPDDPLEWDLHQYIEIAAELNLIIADTATQARLAKDFRNLTAIHIISESPLYAVPSSCLTLGTSGAVDYNSVSALGANGILGVGNLPTDCTSSCTAAGNCTVPCTSAANRIPMYYSCPNGDCQIATVPLSGIVANPVALFSQDNNGALISLPTIPAGGQATASGSLIFGIGTQSNNALGSAQIYATTPDEYFTTTYNGVAYGNSFIDSGSNALYFLDSTTLGGIECLNYPGFYCPASTLSFNVTNSGINGTSGTVSFNIANAGTLFQTGFAAFNDLGGDSGTSPWTDYFDFGVPFFFGRNVFTGIMGKTVPNGVSAPNGYWAH